MVNTRWLVLGMFATVAVKSTLLMVNTTNVPIPVNSRTESADSIQVY